jgi:hypothetical protein
MDRLSGQALNYHERRVTEFLKQAKADNPELYKETVDRHLVLTESQLRYRRQREVPLGMLEGEERELHQHQRKRDSEFFRMHRRSR